MRIKFLIISLVALVSSELFAQKFMGVGTDKPNPRAVLELNVENPAGFQQGFLPPRLTTGQRGTFGTNLNSAHKGMTVYDITLDKFYYWDGTAWLELAIVSGGPSNLTALGLGGINVSTLGLGFTIDGSNLVKTTTTGTGNLTGSFANGLSLTGIGAFSISNSPTSGASSILSFDGVSFRFVPNTSTLILSTTDGVTITNGNQINISTASGTSIGLLLPSDFAKFNNSVQTLVGLGGINVGTITGGYTIDGSSFITTSVASTIGDVKGSIATGYTVTGLQGAPINTSLIQPNDVLQFNGTSIIGFNTDGIVKTIVGLGNISVGTITGGYTISGGNAVNTVVGVSGLQVSQTGQSVSVSGAGMVLASQSLGNPIGTSASVFGANPLSRTTIQIPANVKNIKVVINAYKLVAAGVDAQIRVNIGLLSVNIPVTSDNVDLFYTSSNIDVSATTGTQILKLFGQADTLATGVMLSGYTVYVVD